MVFKRRDRRSIVRALTEFVWPRGGWLRAFGYVKHRVRRLPDTPEKIARGVAAGVFTTFTPFFGFHFITAYLIARLVRGNILAALLGTFFGNPLTYVPIAVTSLTVGHFILGTRPQHDFEHSLSQKFDGAARDLFHNFKAIFTPDAMDWTRLHVFYDDVFLPFMVGGIIPGLVVATFVYYLSVPVIRAYQKSRQKKLGSKLNQLSKSARKTPDDYSLNG